MKVHTTNYYNTLILASEDCPVISSEIPPEKTNKSIASLQFDLIYSNPYKYNSDEVLFSIYSIRKGLLEGDLDVEKEHFFSIGKPCFRASPLTKRYGWCIHYNQEGKMALIDQNSFEFNTFIKDDNVVIVKAMRNKRKK